MEVETDMSSEESWNESWNECTADSEELLEVLGHGDERMEESQSRRNFECEKEPNGYTEEFSETDLESSDDENKDEAYEEQKFWEKYVAENQQETPRDDATGVAAVKKQAEKDRQKILLRAINRARHSDLHFMCKDGEKVYASKLLCTGRSKKLDAILGRDTSALKVLKVKVPDIPSLALLAIIEFLYTGDINHYKPMEWKEGLEILRTAHVFDLPHVDKIVDRFLLEEVKDFATIDGWPSYEDLCDMLNLAMELEFLRHRDDLISLSRLAYQLRWKWMYRDFAGLLSEESADFILQYTRQRLHHRHGNEMCVKEYFRLFGVLYWAANKYEKDLAQDDLFKLFAQIPIEKERLYRKGKTELKEQPLVWLPGYKLDDTSNLILRMLERHRPCREAVLRLVKHIDWVRIPPPLFLQVIEPLKIVPDSQLFEIYRSHYSLCRSCGSLKIPLH